MRARHVHALQLADPDVVPSEAAAGDRLGSEPGDDERARRGREIVGAQVVWVGVGLAVPLDVLQLEGPDERDRGGRVEAVVGDAEVAHPSRRRHCSRVGRRKT
jgi:hypothetical protein